MWQPSLSRCSARWENKWLAVERGALRPRHTQDPSQDDSHEGKKGLAAFGMTEKAERWFLARLSAVLPDSFLYRVSVVSGDSEIRFALSVNRFRRSRFPGETISLFHLHRVDLSSYPYLIAFHWVQCLLFKRHPKHFGRCRYQCTDTLICSFIAPNVPFSLCPCLYTLTPVFSHITFSHFPHFLSCATDPPSMVGRSDWPASDT